MSWRNIQFHFVAVLVVVSITSPLLGQTDRTHEEEPVSAEGFGFLRDFFNYDKQVPLESRVVDREERAEYVREKIVFRSVRDQRVPAFLAIPKDDANSHRCVLLVHGLGLAKSLWWEELKGASGTNLTMMLLSAGYAVMTLDAPYHGERAAFNDYEPPTVFMGRKRWFYRGRDMIVDSAVEYRRAMDYLETRSEIDATQVAVVGYSLGGLTVFQLAAVDPRVKVSVACVAPIIQQPYSAAGIVNFAPHIRDSAFLMVIGDKDRNYSVEGARAVFDSMASNTKDLIIFESGHLLPSEWTVRAGQWVKAHLK